MNIVEFYRIHTIDDDFDEKFYQSEYPEVKYYYQPYCIHTKINDRHRLFYHWYNHGKSQGLYKNIAAKQEKNFSPIITRQNKKKGKLAILTTHFNPCNYINSRNNYLTFSKHMESFGDLFTIELSFDNKFFTDNQSSIHIKGKKSNILWQKEVLLNTLLEQIPKEYTNIAWIDSDIIFRDPYWHIQLDSLLNNYKILQLFSHGYRINSEGLIVDKNKFISRVKYHPYGVTGFAWASRREVIDEIKFLDNQILGGADYVMCAAFMNEPSLLEKLSFYHEPQTAIRWIENASRVVNKSVSFLDTGICHLYHGTADNRNYSKRYNAIKNYSPDNFKKIDNLWTCKNKNITQHILSYFSSRQEDDNVLAPNDVFDQIYVLNLDREPEKYDTISKKLQKLNINSTRFSGVDGKNLDFDESSFVQGRGLLENKYALGCAKSHIELVRHAQKNGYKKILILEDDAIFSKNFMPMFQNIKKLKSWKILYLGASQHDWSNIEYLEHFYLAKKSAGTFAYALDCSVYNDILKEHNDDYTIDFNLSAIQEKYNTESFVFYPNIVISNVEKSSIREKRDQHNHGLDMKWNITDYEY